MVIFFENFCVVFYDSLPAMDCNLIRSDLAQGFTQGFGAIFAFPGLFFFVSCFSCMNLYQSLPHSRLFLLRVVADSTE